VKDNDESTPALPESDTTTETMERKLSEAQRELLTYGLALMFHAAMSVRDGSWA
jgi:hypothetical protein